MYDDAGEWVFQYIDNKIDSVRVDAFKENNPKQRQQRNKSQLHTREAG